MNQEQEPNNHFEVSKAYLEALPELMLIVSQTLETQDSSSYYYFYLGQIIALRQPVHHVVVVLARRTISAMGKLQEVGGLAKSTR